MQHPRAKGFIDKHTNYITSKFVILNHNSHKTLVFKQLT